MSEASRSRGEPTAKKPEKRKLKGVKKEKKEEKGEHKNSSLNIPNSFFQSKAGDLS